MSTSWVLGFIIGIMIVVVVSTVAMRLAKKKGGACRGQYDERQLAARGNAFKLAYYTLLIYLAVWMVLRSLEVPFFSEYMSVLVGVLLSLGVFVGYAIFHDAYLKASESPKAWMGIIGAVGLLNTGIGVGRLFRGETLTERLYDNANLFVGLLLVAVLICIVIKRAMDHGAED